MSDVTVKFGATDVGLAKTLNRIQNDMDRMKSSAKSAEKTVSMSFSTMAKAGAAFAVGLGAVKGAFRAVTGTINSFKEAVDLGGQLSDLQASTGESAGNLLILRRAFDNSGVGADKAGPAINKLQRAIVEAGQGIATYKRAFEGLGINLEDISKQTPTEQLRTMAAAIMRVQNPTERAAYAMQLLGRSGGSLITLFADFDNELQTAQSQLGKLPEIMDRSASKFDAVSDKLNIIKGKFMEFAAGVLDRTIPLLDAVTEALSRLDAAAIGMKLADVFVGGQKAMEGFQTAVDAIKLGKFSDAFSIAMTSAKLQAIQTVNEVYKNFVASMSAAKAFLLEAFGPTSSAWAILRASFSILSSELSIKMGQAISAILGGIPKIGNDIKESVASTTKMLEQSIKNNKNIISNVTGEIGNDFVRAGDKATEAFDGAYKSAKTLIDPTKTEIELAQERLKIYAEQRKEAEAKAKAEMAGFPAIGPKFDLPMQGVADNAEKAAEAQKDGTKAAVENMQKQLTLSEQILENIKKAREAESIDKGGALAKEANDAIASGNFKKAQRIADKIAANEMEARIRGEGEKRDTRSLMDIAKEEGIDVFRKSKEDIRKELFEKRKKDAEKEKDQPADMQEADGKAPQDEKPKDPHPLIEQIVELLKKIEPKLPGMALGI